MSDEAKRPEEGAERVENLPDRAEVADGESVKGGFVIYGTQTGSVTSYSYDGEAVPYSYDGTTSGPTTSYTYDTRNTR